MIRTAQRAPEPQGEDGQGDDLSAPIQHDARTLAMREVHRAIGELRRGTPVLLRGPQGSRPAASLLVAAAETVSGRGLAELSAGGWGAPVVLLAASRAAGLGTPARPGEEIAALRAAPALLDPAVLRRLADPTAERLLPEPPQRVPLPPLSAAAIGLVKLARLLPVLVAVPARPGWPAPLPGGLSGGLLPGGQSAAVLHGGQPAAILEVAAADVLAYPATAATSLIRVAEARVPLEDAPDARIAAFRAADGGIEHLAILVGTPETAVAGAPPLCRVHSECFTGDLMGSLRCDCGPQLRRAVARMAAEGQGVLLYLAQEGRGIGLVNKLRAYALQDQGLDTLDANRALGYGADERDFLVAAEMLRVLGIPRVRLLTNNPDKVEALSACGVEVQREPHQIAANGVNDGYLRTKARRFGHLLG